MKLGANHKKLLYYLLTCVCLSGTLGFTLKFTTTLNSWLPFFKHLFNFGNFMADFSVGETDKKRTAH